MMCQSMLAVPDTVIRAAFHEDTQDSRLVVPYHGGYLW